ncbi:MAG: hypothetical protein J4N30_03805, partial [Chloroflexi bacterium]|nr:hypothetical protein [Chloroflexota bacterium]
ERIFVLTSVVSDSLDRISSESADFIEHLRHVEPGAMKLLNVKRPVRPRDYGGGGLRVDEA